MIAVKKVPIHGPEYESLKEKDFFGEKGSGEMVDGVCRMGDVNLYVAESGEIYGFALISLATGDAVSILGLGISADFGEEDIRKALLDFVLEDLNPKAIVGEVTEAEVDFYEKYGFYTTEIGENLPGQISYYVTYRYL